MEEADIFAKQTAILAQQEGVAPVDVLKDIAQSSEVTAKFTDATGENIAKAAIMAKKLGVNLNTIASVAEGLLDFQTSIGKEVELSVLLGKQLNFQRARELALANDLEGMMSEVVKQLGSEEELLKMNAIQRKAIADTLGVSVSDISKFVDNQGKANTITKALAQSLGIEKLVGEEALASLEKLMNAFMSFATFVAETLLPVLEPMFAVLDATVGALLRSAFVIKGVLLPALTALAVYYAVAAFNAAGFLSVSTVGLGIAAAILAMATWTAWTSSNKPRRYQNLPMGEGAFIQSGTAIADPGEAIVHQADLGVGSKEVADRLDKTNSKLDGLVTAIKSLELRTSVTNKDLNIVMTPKNA
jgi:predicted XRE-type DNA-binding protein